MLKRNDFRDNFADNLLLMEVTLDSLFKVGLIAESFSLELKSLS